MIALFNRKNPANILVLVVFGVLIKLPIFTSSYQVAPGPGDNLLYKAIIDFLNPSVLSFPKLYPILTFLLLMVQALVLNHFINSQRMTGKPSWFPAMAYLLLTSLLPEWNYFSAPLIVNTILLYIIITLFSTYNQDNAKGKIFNAGLASGLASFIFFPSVTFLFWILLALMIMRPFRLNEWVLCLLGATTPFYFYAVYLFITDQWSWQSLLPAFSVHLPAVRQSAWLAGSTLLMVVPFLTGAWFVQNNLRRMLIQVRKGWSLMLLYLLGALFIPFVGHSRLFENWIIAAIPFAAFHACAYMYSSYKIFPVLLFWLTVLFVLACQYYGPGWQAVTGGVSFLSLPHT